MNDLSQRFLADRLGRARHGTLAVIAEPGTFLDVERRVRMYPDLVFTAEANPFTSVTRSTSSVPRAWPVMPTTTSSWPTRRRSGSPRASWSTAKLTARSRRTRSHVEGREPPGDVPTRSVRPRQGGRRLRREPGHVDRRPVRVVPCADTPGNARERVVDCVGGRGRADPLPPSDRCDRGESVTDRRRTHEAALDEGWVEPWLAHDCPERPFDHGTWIDDCRACRLSLRAEAARSRHRRAPLPESLSQRLRWAATPQPVAFGWPGDASMSQTVRLASSMQYQSRPPPVTSYCHCSISFPLTVRLPRTPLRGCCRSVRSRGSAVSLSHAMRALPGAAAQTSSQPFTASLVP